MNAPLDIPRHLRFARRLALVNGAVTLFTGVTAMSGCSSGNPVPEGITLQDVPTTTFDGACCGISVNPDASTTVADASATDAPATHDGFCCGVVAITDAGSDADAADVLVLGGPGAPPDLGSALPCWDDIA